MKKLSSIAVALVAASLSLESLAEQKGDVTINNFSSKEFHVAKTDTGWSFAYARKLGEEGAAERCRELLLNQRGWKQHPKHAYIRGYNGDITLKISTPGPISELGAKAQIVNYADARTRKNQISYSSNGIDFHVIADKEFAGGAGTVDGSLKMPANSGVLWLRFSRILEDNDPNGRRGYVVFSEISFRLKGEFAPEKPAARSTADATEEKNGLKAFFPTGVFWPWERTRPNAELAGMEFWEFVEATMKLLRDANCNTLWFVNGPGEDARKILALAEKYQLKVMLGTHLQGYFYNGFNSFEAMEDAARKTVSEIGDSPALLAYLLKDEPLLCSLAHCSHFYKLMKKVDPARDTTLVSMTRQTQSFLEESALPVICTDVYLFGHDKSIQIPYPAKTSQQDTRVCLSGMSKIAERHGKHSWLMPQMFGSVWGRYFRRGDKIVVEPGSYLHWRMPTDAETRWQIWEAMRCGIKGVIFYVLFPPIPFWDGIPEQVEPGSIEERMLKSMDRLAATAASWGRQELTKEVTEVDPGQGVLQPGGRPTPQMAAMVEAFGHLRRHADIFLHMRSADFPVFFSSDEVAQTATFIVPGKPQTRYGVVVNDDLDNDRRIKVLLPPNIASVKNLNTGETLKIEEESTGFKSVEFELASGAGCLLEAGFATSVPGMLMLHERFTQLSQHKVKLSKKAEIKRFGAFGIEPFFGVTMTGDFAEPVFSIENLVNRRTANNTVLMNINLGSEQGTVYCMTQGNLNGLEIVAVNDPESLARETNVAHLADDFAKKTSDQSTTGQRAVIQAENFQVPAVVPPGATALEFLVKDGSTRIDNVVIWFVPHAR